MAPRAHPVRIASTISRSPHVWSSSRLRAQSSLVQAWCSTAHAATWCGAALSTRPSATTHDRKAGRRVLGVNADKPFVGKGPQWLYQDETLSGGWEPFDWEMCRKLDEAYQEGAGAVCRIGAVDGAWIDRGGPMNVEGPAHGRGGVVSEIDFSDMTLRQVGHGGVVSQGWVMARWWVTVRGVYPKIATQNTASVLPTAPTSERCLPLSTILRHDLERMIEPIQPAPTRATLRPNRHPSPGWVGPRGTQD